MRLTKFKVKVKWRDVNTFAFVFALVLGQVSHHNNYLGNCDEGCKTIWSLNSNEDPLKPREVKH